MKIFNIVVPIAVIAILGGLCFAGSGVIIRYLLKQQLTEWRSTYLVTEIIVLLMGLGICMYYLRENLVVTPLGLSLTFSSASLIVSLVLFYVYAHALDFQAHPLLLVSGFLFGAGIISIYLSMSVVNLPYIISISRGVGLVATIALAIFVLGDKPTPWQYVGMGVIILGIFMTVFAPK